MIFVNAYFVDNIFIRNRTFFFCTQLNDFKLFNLTLITLFNINDLFKYNQMVPSIVI